MISYPYGTIISSFKFMILLLGGVALDEQSSAGLANAIDV